MGGGADDGEGEAAALPVPSKLSPADEVDFVNREIDRQLDLWRHADNAILGPAGPFVGLSAAFVPAAVLLSDVVDDSRRFYLACVPMGLFLAGLALLIAFRVMGTSMVKHGHQLRVGALRAFFVDRSPDLGGYMFARVGGADVEAELRKMAEQTPGRVIVNPLVAGSSCLMGVVAGFVVWWATEDAEPWFLTTAGVVATVAAAGVELTLLAQRRRWMAHEIAADLGIDLR